MLNKTHLVLLVNLGSPDLLTIPKIRQFLKIFLKDRRVVNLPKLIWYPILYGIILTLRPRKLIHKYQAIWSNNGSPLAVFTKHQATELNKLLHNTNMWVEYAFSYSSPSITDTLTKIHKSNANIERMTVIPLYPQFSSTTTMPVFDVVSSFYKDKLYLPELHFIKDFHAHEGYINLLSHAIQTSWNLKSKGQQLIFSYHGIPQSLVDHGDIYYTQCINTSHLVAKKLNLTDNDYQVVFQSQFGKQQWIGPSLTTTLKHIAEQNIKTVDIICPGFVSDCLETLEEVELMNKKVYIDAGGIGYNYIPCMNANIDFIKLLQNIVVA